MIKEERVYFSDSLGGMMKTMNQDQKELVFEMYKFYKKEYTHHLKSYDNLSVIYSFLRKIDELVDKKLKSDSMAKEITCKKGCYYCCQQNVDISPHEAELLLYTIKEKGIDIDMDKLKRQAKHTVRTWPTQPEEDLNCIFLKDGLCQVYENRPSSCRKYFVMSIPKRCNPKGVHKIVKRYTCLFPEVLASVICNMPGSGSLPSVLLKSL